MDGWIAHLDQYRSTGAPPAGTPPAAVHLLIWAIGLALVDGCWFDAAREALVRHATSEAMLVVAPLRLERATSSLVNPLLLL